MADLMDRCSGAVVVAVERYWFNEGIERRGGAKERRLSTVSLPTSWNQIEAAMAYSRGMPLLVIVDERLRCDGLLEKGNDWFVHELVVDLKSLNSPAFLGLLDDWRQRVSEHSKTPQLVSDPSKMSIAALLGALSLPQIWGLLGALSILLGGAFSLGTIYKTFGEASEKSEVSNKNQTDATDIKRQR
ncbi:hypothetical protein [Sphingobium sp.]|uniref:hypothetical protein n=1 Tax=Sphingobium sp. TaxID=1912891 RepID=UPI0028BEFA40|nr:hypothetical protein [Sphingobium sp.]